MSDLKSLYEHLKSKPATERMPALFVGHGNPMNAIEPSSYHKSWAELGKALPRPKAILAISAHWITMGKTEVSTTLHPETIHDFGGFPRELFAQQYPAPGTPEFAMETMRAVHKPEVLANPTRGLDHGSWSVLLPMYPAADIPVYQLSLDYGASPQTHLEMGRYLKALRDHGVMILGSGNVVHNLQLINWNGGAYDWALEFDKFVDDKLEKRDFTALANFQSLGQLAKLAHPTYDHYLPLLPILGLVEEQDQLFTFNDSIDLGSVSMLSFVAA